MSQPVVQLNIGDTVPLGTILANIHLMGVVTDPTVPNMFAASLEMFGDQGVLTVPVLQGPPGPSGQPQFALDFQNDNLNSPSELPTDLTNTQADIGKYWIFENIDSNNNVVGTTAYIWYGTSFRQMPMGSQGPPGPYPIITPLCTLIPPDQVSNVVISGPASNPQLQFNLAVPRGPQGPGAALASCPDVNLSTPATLGQVLGWNGAVNAGGQQVWQPMSVGDILPAPYTVPEAAFQAFTGISTNRQTVCTWQAPAQNWPWQPFVWGQVRIGGLDISFSPLLIGAEVRLNDPNNGPLLSYGTGQSTGSTTLVPHTSSSGSPNTAMTPDNNYALVPAGTAPNIYVNLLNEGLATLFDFHPSNAGICMLALPARSG